MIWGLIPVFIISPLTVTPNSSFSKQLKEKKKRQKKQVMPDADEVVSENRG